MTDALYYAVRLVKNGPRCPVKIWYGPPLDPLTGQELDRSHRWQALRNGRPVDLYQAIVEFDGVTGRPVVKGEPITEDEHDYLVALNTWAENHDPKAPEADMRKPVNLRAMPPIF